MLIQLYRNAKTVAGLVYCIVTHRQLTETKNEKQFAKKLGKSHKVLFPRRPK